MKTDINIVDEFKFKPIKVEIILENESELVDLYNMMNHAYVTDSLVNSVNFTKLGIDLPMNSTDSKFSEFAKELESRYSHN